MALFRRLAAASAFAAAISMSAGSAAAVDLPASAGPAAVHQADKAEGYGWRGYRHRRDRVDAGDVLAGVLILGTIAAVASAARNDRDRGYPDQREPWPQDRQRYDTREWDDEGSRGLDRAVDICVDEVERGRGEVDIVDSVNRRGDGWDVRGRLDSGSAFTCRIGNDGRVGGIVVDGGRADAAPTDDRQYGDEVYARARASGNAPGTVIEGEADDRPVWTGDDRAAAPPAGDDGRYGASGTPDFEQVG